MVLQDLVKGDEITIEIVWGNSIYHLPSKVVVAWNKDIYIEPLTYNGHVIDLSRMMFRDMTYNIYAINKETDHRVKWNNIHIEPVVLKSGDTVYSLKTYEFARNSVLSERRVEDRTQINIPGIVYLNEGMVPIRIRDISASGLSFTTTKGAEINNGLFQVEFTDSAKGDLYDILLHCRFVRRVEQGMEALVGCALTKQSKDLLFYIFNKRLERV